MGIIKLHRLLCAALLLAGCAASNNPPERKSTKAPPMPPTPPGLKIQKASTARISTTSVSATPDSQFASAARFGDVADDGGTCVAVDRNRNVFIGGTVQVDTGSPHPFLMKCSSSGVVVWSNTFPGNMTGSITALGVDRDGNVLVTGSFSTGIPGVFDVVGLPLISSNNSYDIFVAKLSGDGTRALWAKRFGSPRGGYPPDESSTGLAVDTNDNSVVVTGFYGSDVIDFGGGSMPASSGRSMFVVKLSLLDGSHRWSRGVSTTAFTKGNAVAVDADGNVFVTGGVLISGGGVQYTVDFGGGALPQSSNSMFLVKYLKTGLLAWVKQFGVSAEGRALDVNANNVVVTGTYNVTINFGGQTLTNPPPTSPIGLPSSMFVANFSAANGAHNWSKKLSGGPTGSGVSVGPSGNITTTTVWGYVISLGADGTQRWSKSFAGNSQCSSVATDANGRSYVTGKFFGSVDFGGGPVTSAGRSDIFLVEFGEPSPPSTSTGTMQISEKFVDPVNGDIFIVSDLQQANMDIAFRMQTRPGGPRQTIGTWGASLVSQRVGVSLQAGLPVAWVDTVQTTPAAAARMAPASLTDTGWRTKGYKIYRAGSRTFVLKP